MRNHFFLRVIIDAQIVRKSLLELLNVNTAIATLSTKFQISIPKTIRELNHWRAGQEFAFLPKGRGVLVMPVVELEELIGLARGAETGEYRDREDRV